jgi:hypothetical protein
METVDLLLILLVTFTVSVITLMSGFGIARLQEKSC